MRSFEEELTEKAADIICMLVKKNHDYGTENLLATGEHGIVIRLMDKVARLRNFYFTRDGVPCIRDVENETIEDTIRDIAGYCMMFLMMRSGLLRKFSAMEDKDEI